MTSTRRLQRDRRRYNAFRRLQLRLWRILEQLNAHDSFLREAMRAKGRPRHYVELQRECDVLAFRGWARCSCGLPRQSIRLS